MSASESSNGRFSCRSYSPADSLANDAADKAVHKVGAHVAQGNSLASDAVVEHAGDYVRGRAHSNRNAGLDCEPCTSSQDSKSNAHCCADYSDYKGSPGKLHAKEAEVSAGIDAVDGISKAICVGVDLA